MASSGGAGESVAVVAGAGGPGSAAAPQDLRVLTDVNLGAALWLSPAVGPPMRQRGAAAPACGTWPGRIAPCHLPRI